MHSAVWSALESLLVRVRSGYGGALFIDGEAGSGKSTLLAEFRESASGARVLSGAAVAAEAGYPLALLGLLLQQLRPDLARLGEEKWEALEHSLWCGIPDSAAKLRCCSAVLEVTSLIAHESGPLLFLVDNVEQADKESLEVLSFVSRRICNESVGVVLAGSGAQVSAMLEGVDRVPIGGMGSQQMREVLDTLDGTLAVPVREKVVELSCGNVKAAHLVVRALDDTQRNGRLNPYAVLNGMCLKEAKGSYPSAVHRTSEFSEHCRLLAIIAASDDSGEVRLVSGVCELLGVPRETLDAAERDGWLRNGGGHFQFSHPLCRLDAYASATTGERAFVHRAFAEVAAELGLDSLRVWHHAAASAGPSEEVAGQLEEWAKKSAGWGACTANEHAAWHTDPNDGDGRRRRLVSAAGAAVEAGLFCKAREMLHESEALGAETAPLPLEGEPRTLTDGVAIAALAVSSAVEFETGDIERARNLLISTAFDLPVEAIQEGEQLLHRAEQYRRFSHGAGEAGDGRGFSVDKNLRPSRSYDSCDVSRALRDVQRCRTTGTTGLLPYALFALGQGLLQEGRFADADPVIAEALLLCKKSGQIHLAARLNCLRAWLAGVRNEFDPLEPAERALQHGRRYRIPTVMAAASRAIIQPDLSRGRYTRASERLQEAMGAEFFAAASTCPTLMSDAVECLVGAGGKKRSAEVIAALEGWAVARGTPAAAEGLLLRCRSLAGDPGDSEEAMRRSVLILERSGWYYEQGRSELLLGKWLRRQRRRREAVRHLESAEQLFLGMGAIQWACRAREEKWIGASACGQKTPVGSLTVQERHVVRLAAEGGTNPQIARTLFLSPKTVANHLYRAFPKLGVTSRTQLRALPLDHIIGGTDSRRSRE